MLVFSCVPAFAEDGGCRLFLWVELIGFDNTKPDMGVGDYLSRIGRKPEGVTLLLNNESLFRSHVDLKDDYPLHFSNCAYRGRPHNPERRRQDWTAYQLRQLVSELQTKGVKVLASFFCWDAFPADDAYMDAMAAKLVPFLKDYGFDGFHAADGYAPPFYPLPQCADKDRPSVARRNAARYAANFARLVKALKPEGLECWLNSCWTRDPYEAMFRYGVDHRLLANAGITGFFVESSAAAQKVEGWSNTKAEPIDKSQAMILRLKASVPDTPCIPLHGINDGAEQWSALRHGPALAASEALALASLFHGKSRAIDGFLVCLADGLSAHEWEELGKTWSLAFSPAKGPEGIRVVWSDRAFDAEFDACAVSRDASSYTLLYELIRRGAIVNASVDVKDALADPSLPVLVLNPAYFPADELEGLRRRPAQVVEIGRGARAPNTADYVMISEEERKISGMPYNAGWDNPDNFTKALPENMPPDFIFDRVAQTIKSFTAPFEVLTEGVRACAFRLENGRLGIMARSENKAYSVAQFSMSRSVSDVRIHTAFPSLPVRTVLEGRIAPQETIFLSVGEREDDGPNRPPEPREHVLDNDGQRLAFAPSDGGFACLGLRDAESGVSFFNGGETCGLWRLVFRNGPSGKDVALEARSGVRGFAERTADGIRFRWQGLDLAGERGAVDVACDVVWNAADRQYEFRIAVANRSRTYGLFSTEYPVLSNAVDPDKGTALLPGGNFGLVRSSGKAARVETTYPRRRAPMQFAAFEQGGACAYFAAHDAAANVKDVRISSVGEVAFGTIAENAGVPGAGSAPDFPFVLATGKGTWWQAAKRYRRWAVANAPWTRKGPIASRADFPSRLRDNGLWFRFYGDSAKIARLTAEAERRVAGRVPFGVHWYWWHAKPFDDSYPEYFPPKDGFAETVKDLSSRGVLVMPYVNARLWDADIPSYGAAESSVVAEASGERLVETYKSRRRLAVMCPATPLWQKTVGEVCARLIDEFGVPAVYLDQIAAARPARCFDAAHGHPLGGGSHWVDGYRALLEPIHDKAAAKGVPLAVENDAEPYMDNLDAHLLWALAGGDDVPAFPAVYSGYTTWFSSADSAQDEFVFFRAYQLRNFLWGTQLGWMQDWILDDAHRDHLECLIRLGELRVSNKSFFSDGELLGEAASAAENPPFHVKWSDEDGATAEADIPSVQATLWRDPSGRTLLVAANLSDERREFKWRSPSGVDLAFGLEGGEAVVKEVSR